MVKPNLRLYFEAFITGILVAFSAAIMIRFFPESWLLNSSQRIGVFAFSALCSPPIVILIRWIARTRRHPVQQFFYVGNIAALLFDSTATGFAPQIYGHSGDASRVVIAAIAFGFFTIFLIDQLLPAKEDRKQ